MHYKRYIDDEFVIRLKDDYSFILDVSRIKIEDFVFDVQLRPKNTLMIYSGGTCIVEARFNKKTGKISFLSKSYGNDDQLFNNEITNLKSISDSLNTFIQNTIPRISDKWNTLGYEGYWEQRVSKLWGGCAWQSFMDYLVIDRQSVINFDNKQQKDAFYANLNSKYFKYLDELCSGRMWMKKKSFGDEVDLLAINSRNELVCIEIKTASQDKNFYYAPLQLAYYCEAFSNVIKDISSDINKLVIQKVELGLLPENALKRIPVDDSNVKSVLLLMDSFKLSLESDVWKRLDTVVNHIDERFRPQIIAIP